MPTKRRILQQLKPNELLAAVDRCELEVADRRVRDLLIDALAASRKAPIDDTLAPFYRDRLKELCRALLDFRLDPAWLALSKPRQRILIAESVGLGENLEAGILLSERIHGRRRRILVTATDALLSDRRVGSPREQTERTVL